MLDSGQLFDIPVGRDDTGKTIPGALKAGTFPLLDGCGLIFAR